jgi:urease alpha subunit
VADKDTQVNLAVYMERLDSYISSQTALTEKLSDNIEKVETKVDDISQWRSKMYGMKSILVALGVLVVHTTAVMGSFVAIINFNK